MRRTDREITNKERIKEIILSCQCCRLGFYDNGEVYIVPLSFGYDETDGKRTFYFHGAKHGRKIDLISRTCSVGFELDTNYRLIEGKTACEHSALFQSIIGTGVTSIIEKPDEKKSALQVIMLHQTEKKDWTFSDAMLDATYVFKLEVKTISCKEHQ